jgi:hypothetical protein
MDLSLWPISDNLEIEFQFPRKRHTEHLRQINSSRFDHVRAFQHLSDEVSIPRALVFGYSLSLSIDQRL